jgi:hypothetical protein
VRLAGLPQRIPHLERGVGRHPYLVAEVSGVAGPCDIHVDAADLGSPMREVRHAGPIATRSAFEDVPGARTLDGDRRDLF